MRINIKSIKLHGQFSNQLINNNMIHAKILSKSVSVGYTYVPGGKGFVLTVTVAGSP